MGKKKYIRYVREANPLFEGTRAQPFIETGDFEPLFHRSRPVFEVLPRAMAKRTLGDPFIFATALWALWGSMNLVAHPPQKNGCVPTVLSLSDAEDDVIELSRKLPDKSRIQKLKGVVLYTASVPYFENKAVLFGFVFNQYVPLIFYHHPEAYSLFPLGHLADKIQKRAEAAQKQAESVLIKENQPHSRSSFLKRDLVDTVPVDFAARLGLPSFTVPVFPTVFLPHSLPR